MLVAIGVVIGLAGAFAGMSSLTQFLYGISALDAVTFVAVPRFSRSSRSRHVPSRSPRGEGPPDRSAPGRLRTGIRSVL